MTTTTRRGRHRTVWLTVGVLLLTAAVVQAAEPRNARFERISLNAGLSQAFVTSMLQDREGFMWFGTQEGLNRFDGYDFLVFTHNSEDSDSLSHDSVQTVISDGAGAIWVGTDGGGLNRFDPRTRVFTSYRNVAGDPTSLSHDRVQVLLEDRDGRIWVGTDGGGLNLMRSDGAFSRFDLAEMTGSEAAQNIRSIVQDSAGILWIGTDGGGLLELDPSTSAVVVHRNDPEDPGSLSDNRVNYVYEDRVGRLWVGTYRGGLDRFDRSSGAFHHYRSDPSNPESLAANGVRTIYEDSHGTLWVGTDGGLNEWRPESGSFLRYQHDPTDSYSLSHNRVVSIFEDRGGILWVGTYSGLVKWNRATESFKHFRHSTEDPTKLSESYVTAFAEAPSGDVWVGTYGGGVNRLDPAASTFEHLRNRPGDPASLEDDRVMSLYVDRAGTLWVGTLGGGLARRNADGSMTHFVHDPDDPTSLSWNGVTTMLDDRQGRFWVGTYRGGLNLMDRKRGTFQRFRHDADDPESLSSDRVLILREDRAGRLWVGTDGGGLNLFDPRRGRFLAYRTDAGNPDSLSSNHIWTLLEDEAGNLWLGTQGGGLNRWAAADRGANRPVFTRYTKSDGMASDIVYGTLLDEQGMIWISSNRGITRFDPDAESFLHFDVSHGLQNNEFNYGAAYKARDGQMYFGGINGFNVFSPDQIVRNQHVPPVVLTRILKMNQPIVGEGPFTTGGNIELGYRDYVVDFEFAALDYAAPRKNRYKYKLEGLDKEWVELDGRRRVTYTNLRAGDYTFLVKASNNDGLWNDEALRLEVGVEPPPWRTWWAESLYGLAIGLGLLVYTRGQRRKRQRARELAHTNRVLNEEISRREAKEMALEREKAKAQRYLEVAEVIMLVIDRDRRVALINRKGCRVLGCEEAEVVGRDWIDTFVPAEERERVGSYLVNGKKNEYLEYKVLTKAGDQRIVAWHSTLLHDEKGNVAGSLSSGSDITQMRQLREEKEIAESSNRAKSQFLANMSHEIRTPMNGVLGMTELLMETELTERQQRLADTARRSARNLLNILNDILDFSKIEAGKLELETVDFDLLELIEDVMDLFAERALQKGLELNYLLPPDVPAALVGDPTRLRQILSNLVGNAIKFTERGEVSLRVSGSQVVDSSVGLLFEVSDTGVGLDAEAEERIFESFHQADGSTTRKYGGTGLGLAISRQLVDMMSGEMGVESELGEGSVFWFTVDLELSERVPRRLTTLPGAERHRVLVVDPNENSRESLRRRLELWGIHSEGARDAIGALRRLRGRAGGGQAYSEVLIDVERDGSTSELAAAVAADSVLAGVRVIEMVPMGGGRDDEAGAQRAVATLAKPVRSSDLLDTLLGRQPAETGAEAAVASSPQTVDLEGLRILLVEDNPVNQEVVRAMLERIAVRLDVAGNGSEAVELSAVAEYDLVLMDCQMPLMDGFQATRVIRAREDGRADDGSARRLPIVAMTASAMSGDHERCLAAGMDDYLSKPFRLEQLLQVVRRWAGSQTEASAAAAPPLGASASPEEALDGGQFGSSTGAPAGNGNGNGKSETGIDHAVLEQIGQLADGGSRDLVERVIRLYLDSSPELLEALSGAIAAGDTAGIGSAAHTLKSSSGNLGALRLAHLCHEMEGAARRDETREAKEIFATLEAEFECVREELVKECRQAV